MEEKKCSGNCIACSFQQQVYCAAQHGHAIMAALPAVFDRFDRIQAALAKFDKGSDFINPLSDEAQQGAGAENRAPIINNPSNNGL